jgi:uncharacterized membrane protein
LGAFSRFGRDSFGVRFVTAATAAGAARGGTTGATTGAGAGGAAAVIGRLNGMHRRHVPATMFQQFGQTARAQDGQSWIGAVRSSPS